MVNKVILKSKTPSTPVSLGLPPPPKSGTLQFKLICKNKRLIQNLQKYCHLERSERSPNCNPQLQPSLRGTKQSKKLEYYQTPKHYLQTSNVILNSNRLSY